ncbi:hypothetical protein ABW20_dc0109941 [Dactylellina cionopaga]|nr:hypothetical protein ABW20_dc0109941 [Dactylellina cionopaga]
MGILTRYYGPQDNGDNFITLFTPFGNLTRIEFDERAAVTWPGYLKVVANILVTKPKLESLTLRHRLGLQPMDKIKADMAPIRKILNRGVVAKLRSLSIILGRRFEASEMGYEYFRQLMEVFEGATGEVTAFKVFASYSKLDENDLAPLDNGILHVQSGGASLRSWCFPKLRDVELHMHNFPSLCPVRSIAAGSLANTKKLKIVCDVMKANLDLVSSYPNNHF